MQNNTNMDQQRHWDDGLTRAIGYLVKHPLRGIHNIAYWHERTYVCQLTPYDWQWQLHRQRDNSEDALSLRRQRWLRHCEDHCVSIDACQDDVLSVYIRANSRQASNQPWSNYELQHDNRHLMVVMIMMMIIIKITIIIIITVLYSAMLLTTYSS